MFVVMQSTKFFVKKNLFLTFEMAKNVLLGCYKAKRVYIQTRKKKTISYCVNIRWLTVKFVTKLLATRPKYQHKLNQALDIQDASKSYYFV